jgi:hypothetical protein
MRTWSILAIALALLVTLHRPASAWTFGDTLTVIWKPLPNLPTILRPGDTLTVWAKASSTASNWDAALRLGTLSYPLAPAGGGWDSSYGWWVLGFSVPQGLAEESYDLTMTCSDCPPDTARRAVKVLPAFKSDFYFAQISDTHVPSRVYSSDAGFSVSDTTGLPDFNAVINDLNFIHPEFVLHTGDLVNEGELEEYLGMYEMGRAQAMIQRLRDPVYFVSGNHDIGGWDLTPPPAGTSRKNWWRYFGWPALANPPAGYPYHSQVYSFDYGLLHCIGMEGYQNSGGYDDYLPAVYGSNSMTQEQMNWLAADVAAVPGGHSKLAFFHYDFSNQFTNLATLGLDGAIWGHNHGVTEGNRTAKPFNLGLQSVSYSGSGTGGRAFRIFRVSNGVITPGPMHRAGGTTGTPTDSLSVTWAGANDGTRSALTATVVNRYGEAWNYSQLVFHLADHDSTFSADRGTITQLVRQGGKAAIYVDCPIGASQTFTVTVSATDPIVPTGVTPPQATALRLSPPRPNPFRSGSLSLDYALPVGGQVHAGVYDLAGRLVATLFSGSAEAGEHALAWSGRSDSGDPVEAGIYLVRLATPAGERRARFVVLR